MAEAFGIVSGGLSVFSLAIQIASSLKTIKDFLDVVKETPTEVRLILNELEVLSLILHDIEQSVNDQTSTLPAIRPAVNKAIKLCKTSSDSLESVAQEVGAIISSSRRWSSFKVGLKKDRLTRLRMQLENIKTLLTLANQCYYNAVQRQDWEMQHRNMNELKYSISTISSKGLSNLRELDKQAESNMVPQDTQSNENMGQSSLHFDTMQLPGPACTHNSRLPLVRYLVGSLELNHAAKRQSPTTRAPEMSANIFATEERCLNIQLPLWLLHRRYQIRYKSAYSGWDYRFRTYYPTSSSDKVFSFCMEGNVQGLQNLFQAGLASPFNTDYNGFTTLHYAVARGRIEAAQFLLRCGVDINAKSGPANAPCLTLHKGYGACTPLQMFAWLGAHLLLDNYISVSEHQDVLRFLIENEDNGLADVNNRGQNPLQLYIGPTSTYSWFLACGEPELRYETLTEPLWLHSLNIFFPDPIDPVALLRESLPKRQVTESVAIQITSYGYTILHCTLQRWSHISGRGDFLSKCSRELETGDGREFKRWEQLIRDILRAGGDIHAMFPPSGKTPFLAILSNEIRDTVTDTWVGPLHPSRRSLTRILAAWLRILREEGFDLQAYKEREIQLWDAELLESWGGISRVEFMPHDWVNIHWNTPQGLYEDELELTRSFDYFSMLTGEKVGKDVPPEDGSVWYMVGGRYMAEEAEDSDDEGDEGDSMKKIPGSWV